MKLSKYSDSGAIHRNGITATSSVIWVVVASSITEATIASPNHRTRRRSVGGGAGSSDGASDGRSDGGVAGRGAERPTTMASSAHPPQQTANRTKPADHTQPWTASGSRGSSRNG